MSTQKHALIAGAGIGGLTTAIALQQIGYKTTIFERTNQLEEAGAGLTLWANAVKALRKLGLGDQLTAESMPSVSGQLRNMRGTCLAKTSAEKMLALYGAPTLAIHRADLQKVLLAAAGAENIQTGRGVTDFEQDIEGVRVHLSNGQTVAGDLLIGADGIHSAVRQKLVGDSPLYSGYVAWRGVVEFDHHRIIPGESWGCGNRFGMLRLSGNRVYWFATKNCPADLLNIYRDWYAPIPEIIQKTPPEAILLNDISYHAPLKSWSRGRVTLLGDAAHATTPNLGQGGCMAIEDAVVIAQSLQKINDIPSALKYYEEQRIPRTTSVTNRSTLIGKMGQTENKFACALRNWSVRLSPDFVQLHQLKPFAGYEV
jgi:FAD-dependent urate hydroxylase